MSKSLPSDLPLPLEEYLEDQELLYDEYIANHQGTYSEDPFLVLVKEARKENNRYDRAEGRWPRHPSGKRPRRGGYDE